jgi:hypothetical protein
VKKLTGIIKIIGYVVKIGGWLIDVIGSFPIDSDQGKEVKQKAANERESLAKQVQKSTEIHGSASET